MRYFEIFTVVILAALLLCASILFVFYIRNRRKQVSNKKIFDEHFNEVVCAGFKRQSEYLKNGDIKMNILTNDSLGDNNLLIMDKFEKLLNSDMFDELSKIDGANNLWKI